MNMFDVRIILLLAATTASDRSIASAFTLPLKAASSRRRPQLSPASRTVLNAIERLHDGPTNCYGPLEHVYSLKDINTVTLKVSDDEWTALGIVVAESVLETVVDFSGVFLEQMQGADRDNFTRSLSYKISETVTTEFFEVRSNKYGPYISQSHIPEGLVFELNSLIRRELHSLVGQESFDCRDLSTLVNAVVSEAVESYCGKDVRAPFFSLSSEMNRRIKDRRRRILVKHSKGYESVKDVIDDIEENRKLWVREELGSDAAANFEFGKVTTKWETTKQREHSSFMAALFSDLNGVLIP